MIIDMNANPDHPAAEQAYTTFRLPARPLELALLLVLAALVLNAGWDAVTAGGALTDAPEPIRVAVLAGISYLTIRCARAVIRLRRRNGRPGGFGPDIERIDTP